MPEWVSKYIVIFFLLGFCYKIYSQNFKNTAHVKLYKNIEDLTKNVPQLEKQKMWDKVIQIYVEAISSKDTVIPQENELYAGTRDYALEKLKALPEEAKQLYRQTYQPLAESEFRHAMMSQNINKLREITENYPLLKINEQCLMGIANIAIQKGHYYEALLALEELISFASKDILPAAYARLGLLLKSLGKYQQLQKLASDAQNIFKNEIVIVNNAQIKLLDYMKELLRTCPTTEKYQSIEDPSNWLLEGGNQSRTKKSADVKIEENYWSIPVKQPAYGMRYGLQPRPLIGTLTTLTIPVISDNILYYNDGLGIYAYVMNTKEPCLLWSYSLPQPSREMFKEERTIHTLTVFNGRVYAPLITSIFDVERRLGNIEVKFPFPNRALHCFNAYSGELLWKLGGKIETEKFEENISITSAPVFEGDRLYAGCIYQPYKANPFSHYVICIDANTGKILWSTFIASGLTETNLFGNSVRESFCSPVTILGDYLFYTTNHGVIAALDKKTGAIRWAFRYQQIPIEPAPYIYYYIRPTYWSNNPPISDGKVVIFTPMDSEFLYALDIEDGNLRYRLRRNWPGGFICGIDDNKLIVAGDIICIYDINTGRVIRELGLGEAQIVGRPLLSKRYLYVPASNGLYRYNLMNFEREFIGSWRQPLQRTSYMLMTSDAVVVAGQDRIDVYPLKIIEETLSREETSPVNLYAQAVVLIKQNNFTRAEEVLRKAQEICKSDERFNFLVSVIRTKLSEALYMQVLELIQRKNIQEAEKKFALVIEQIKDADKKTEMVIGYSRKLSAHAYYYEAVRSLQELLKADHAGVFRGKPLRDVIKQEIEDIIKKANSRDAYSQYDNEAVLLLSEARKTSSINKMLEVYEKYPNSIYVPQALHEAASFCFTAGKTEMAEKLLLLLINQYIKSEQAMRAFMMLIEHLEKQNRYWEARNILLRMRRYHPDRIISINGRHLSIVDLVKQKLSRKEYNLEDEKLPEISPPLRKSFEYVDRKDIDIKPIYIDRWTDRLLIKSSSRLKLINKKTMDVVWELHIPAIRYLHQIPDFIIIATNKEIMHICLTDGKIVWRYEASGILKDFYSKRHWFVFLEYLPEISYTKVCMVDLSNNKIVWTDNVAGQAISSISTGADLIAFIVHGQDRASTCFIYEIDTGRMFSQLANLNPLVKIIYLDPSMIILLQEGQILAYEIKDAVPVLKWKNKIDDISQIHQMQYKVYQDNIYICGSSARNPLSSNMIKINIFSGKIILLQEIRIHNVLNMIIQENFIHLAGRDIDQHNTNISIFLSPNDFKQIGFYKFEKGADIIDIVAVNNGVYVLAYMIDTNRRTAISELFYLEPGRDVQKVFSQQQDMAVFPGIIISESAIGIILANRFFEYQKK